MRRKSLCYLSLDIRSSFGLTLLRSIQERCVGYGIDLFVAHGGTLCSPNEWESKRNAIYRWIGGGKFDSYFVASIFSYVDQTFVADFIRPFSARPTVTMTERVPGIPLIGVDNSAGFRDLLVDLAADGRPHRYAVIAGPERNVDSAERFATLVDVLGEEGVSVDPARVCYGSFEAASAVEAVRVLLDDRKESFDTLVCFNDSMAIAAMAEIKRRGFRIPEDVRVTGFDNLNVSAYTNPSLTTVDYPVREIGERGVDLIAAMLAGNEVPEVTLLSTRYVRRLSSSPCSAPGRMPRAYGGQASATPRPDGDGPVPLDSGKVISSVLESLERSANVNLPSDKRLWLTGTIDRIASYLENGEDGVPDFIEFLDRSIWSRPENEWSFPLWEDAFALLSRYLGNGDDGRAAADLLAAATYYVEAVRDRSVISQLQFKESEERFLLQIGEDVGTTFELGAISGTLSKYCRHIGIDTCFVVAYSELSMKRSRIIARIEDGEELDVKDMEEFGSDEILPGNLMLHHPSLIMEALYARSEDIGYMLFNLGNHPAVLYKSLRLQISAAIKGARLVSTINRYSNRLEMMVEERTSKLADVNRELKAEISRRERAEKELLKRKNLDSLGLLAGGIAHDFNNILTAISGNLSILALDDGDDESRRRLCEGMAKAVKNAKNLTQQLLTFSMGGAPVKKPMPIIPLVRETVEFTLRGSNVRPSFDIGKDDWKTEIDAGQMSQVINNIVLNAMYAMSGGGTLTVSASAERIAPGFRGEMVPGDYVKVSIADEGGGIPPDIIDRIFDPYFTTKAKGAGLGLSTSLAIVRKHGGDIAVASEFGKGSVFDIFIPLSDKETVATVESAIPDIPAGLNALVLDDDPDVRAVLSAFLARTGERSTVVSEGAEAVRIYAEALDSDRRFDIIVMDLTVPGGMGGSEAMSRILDLDPEARGIVTSGYSDMPVLSDFTRFGFRAALKKPFTFEDFKRAAAEALR